MEISYSEPQLCTYDGDVERPWFVYFDITDEVTGTTLRKQFRGGINYFTSHTERIREGNALLKYWKQRLASGTYNPFSKSSPAIADTPNTVLEAVNRIMALKQTSLRPKSLRNYKDITRIFQDWLVRHGLQGMKLRYFTTEQAQAYMDYLVISKRYGGKTHNNQLGILKSLFNAMTKPGRKWLLENPFAGIELLPEETGKSLAYTEEEARELIGYFKKFDRRMYYAVNFVFHGFIRKTELTRIRVGDIDWTNKTIRMNAADTKNKQQDAVTITEGLMRILLDMGLDMAPKDYYIFGKGMQTCEQRCTRPDDMSDRHLRLRKAAGLWKDDGKSFYSWKHTGVIAYWNKIKDPYAIQRQCRHHSLTITMIYMKSLGLSPNTQFLQAHIEL